MKTLIPRTEAELERAFRVIRSEYTVAGNMGKCIALTCEMHKPKRSDSQNKFLWSGIYGTILKEGGEALAGWTKEDLHDYFLGEWSGWDVIEGFGKKRMRPIRRSSNLNKQDFSDYVAFIQMKAAELGIFIPDPEQERW